MTIQSPALEIKYRKPIELIDYENNARLHSEEQILQILASMDEFGFTNPILIDERGGIIAGHGRKIAALRRNMEQVPTITLTGLSDDQKRAYILADNKIALNGTWDSGLLSLELGSLEEANFDMSLTGFHQKEIDLHRRGSDGQTDDDAIPASSPPRMQPGGIAILGDHRLICGDASKNATMRDLFGTDRINVALTSPPYASQRVYDESSGFKPVPPDEYVDWFDAIQKRIADRLADDGSFFLNIKEHCDDGQRLLYVKDLTLAMCRRWDWRLVDEYAWTHGGTPKGITRRFKNGWEPIFHFTKAEHKFRPDAVKHETDAAVDWGGGHPADEDGMQDLVNKAGARDEVNAKGFVVSGFAYPSNVLRIGKNTASWEHGAMFPVRLPEFFIRAYSDPGDIIFDPFIGSGTTLIAAQKHGRICYALEISPKYCDVVIDRWEQYTGESAMVEN